jgi:hypothetical protein
LKSGAPVKSLLGAKSRRHQRMSKQVRKVKPKEEESKFDVSEELVVITEDTIKIRGFSESYLDAGSGSARFKIKTNLGWVEVTIYKNPDL